MRFLDLNFKWFLAKHSWLWASIALSHQCRHWSVNFIPVVTDPKPSIFNVRWLSSVGSSLSSDKPNLDQGRVLINILLPIIDRQLTDEFSFFVWTNFALFNPIWPQASQQELDFLNFHIISTDSPPWGTWFKTLVIIMLGSREGEREKE